MKTSTASRKKHTAKKPARKWSARVMQRSNALDLESRIFKSDSALKRSRGLLSALLKEAGEEKALRSNRLCQCSISTSIVEAKICLREKRKHWKKPRRNFEAFLEDRKNNN
jgi:hypothetical protein